MEIWQVGILFFVGLVVFFFLLGRFSGGTGAEVLDWDPTERQRAKRNLEDEDQAVLLETMNRRRRAQGRPELAEEDILGGLRRDQERREHGEEA